MVLPFNLVLLDRTVIGLRCKDGVVLVSFTTLFYNPNYVSRIARFTEKYAA